MRKAAIFVLCLLLLASNGALGLYYNDAVYDKDNVSDETTLKGIKYEKRMYDYTQYYQGFQKTQVKDTTASELVSHASKNNPTATDQQATLSSIVDICLVDHQWPQQGYNQQHTGRSPYSTADNPGTEKWRFPAGDWCDGSPVIASDGTIYFGSSDDYLYAVNQDGTLKWKYDASRAFGDFGSHPAIGEDGTIYIGSKFGSTIFAVYPNGTKKWSFGTPDIDTSITLDDNGVLYYGHWEGVDARYPNGTMKWRFYTEQPDSYVMSTPAVDDNGIVYFGSHDNYIYAVYPNGTLKWKFLTDGWVHGSPSIGTDGTIYCGSDDDYLYALYPNNGTQKWKVQLASGMRSSPSQDKDGNLYFGVWENKIYSIAPDGSIRWEFTIGQRSGVWGSTATISDDGTLYIGVCLEIGSLGGGEIIALDLDGNLKWRKTICDSVLCSSPVIDVDGNVYICASNDLVGGGAPGYLHAFGAVENNQPPETPTIDGPTEGEIGTDLKYVVRSDDMDNNPVSYYIDWGDDTNWQSLDFEPGISIPRYHAWDRQGNYTVKVKAIDSCGLESDWATLEITMPKNKPILNVLQQYFSVLNKYFY